ncbi:DUF4321 domain-containing protein [Coprothermobacter platensis]|uniref:DUF4321 domain-containing protein n=1 Tax=Coprothermobacter platensis TaxID=108819 RepID=UPI00037F7471|nr:DUF4321 domain-containing protein [Coprothermobacter platensis]
MRRKSSLPLVWSILIGLFLGTYLGYILGNYIPFFSHAWNLQLGPLALDLGFLKLQFNIALGINAMSLLGVLFMLYVYLVQ